MVKIKIQTDEQAAKMPKKKNKIPELQDIDWSKYQGGILCEKKSARISNNTFVISTIPNHTPIVIEKLDNKINRILLKDDFSIVHFLYEYRGQSAFLKCGAFTDNIFVVYNGDNYEMLFPDFESAQNAVFQKLKEIENVIVTQG